ncbi:hypothetical protein DM02DRAFT_293896 [Periconia macrospinosa]|uniref:Caib baif family enzyme n=1 Tax=Periconia macrospinosa TaxID=97972 RepID=A0A2V1DZW9_9PLEO|nr:hypothetical protein DM02DRAFT_293896 [Periconia macrospinosa]
MTEPATIQQSPPHDDPRPLVNIITPVGMLGYGLKEHETAQAINDALRNGAPTSIILDSGSTDSGPEKLALGTMSAPRYNYVRDLTKLMRLSNRFNIPVIFGSAGGDGSDDHVREIVKIVEEIAAEKGNEQYKFKTISVFSNIDKSFVHERLRAGAVSGCGKPVPPLSPENIDAVPRICSQMGPEPFYDAMAANPDFNMIAGGRTYDPAPYVAYAAHVTNTSFQDTATEEKRRLFGAFTHMGKIMECGASCARPKGSGATATVYADASFDIVPHDPASRCTPISVSAHALYEKTRPDILAGPGGWLDLTNSTYEQRPDNRTVRCRGATFTFSRDAGKKYQIKLEAAKVQGYRTQYMGSYHDPILIERLDIVLDRIKMYVEFQHQDTRDTWKVDWHVYGRDTINKTTGKPGEVFLIGEAVAPTQELANSLMSTARVATVHVPYPGMKATAGSFAYGLGGKTEIPLGPCAEFCIYHLVDLEEGEERLALASPSSELAKSLYHQEIAMIGKGAPPTPPLASVSDGSPSEQNPMKEHDKTFSIPHDDEPDPSTVPVPRTLGELAGVLRSKNSGPFEVTFDAMFKTAQEYSLVKEAGFLTTANIAQLYALKEEDIVWSGFFDQALAWKATIPRLFNGKPQANGGFMESDVHGSQKYAPLFNMQLPESLVNKLEALRQEGK